MCSGYYRHSHHSVVNDEQNHFADPTSRSFGARYGVAVGSVLLATFARVLIFWWMGERIPYATFFPAVLIAALYGGTGPGLVAIVLSMFAAYWFLGDIPPRSQIFFTGTFLSVNVLNLWICAAMRRARTAAGVAIAARQKADRALTASESRFRVMADSAPVLMWITDPDKRCVWVNQPWLDFVGRQMADELGAGWLESVHAEDVARCTAAYSAAHEARQSYTVDFRLRRHDGEYRWIAESGVPVVSGGEFLGFIGSCIDITERKKIEEDRAALLEREQAARYEAERTSRIKDEFLATLSHELRTPLNAILGWSQIIRPGVSSVEEVAEGLAIIQRNARMQTQIISDLLDMSRIISGKIRLELQYTDLRTVIDASIESVQPSADVKGIQIVKSIATDVPPINGDPSRLQQAVWNLLTNAIKFTPRGGVVKVSLARVDSHLQISVIDNGQGISPDFLPHIFERFRQADASTTRSHGGLGIGLSIVKSLLELHGGSVTAASGGKGQGSTFTLNLPMPVIEAAIVGSDDGESSEARPHLRGLRVLIVDDEPDSRNLIGRLLREHEATVAAASSAAEAMAVLQRQAFDVLLSDIGMPEQDGYDLIRELRARGNNIPAMALTAFARSEDRARSLMAGFQSHVTKPVDVRELVATVASLGGRTKAETV